MENWTWKKKIVSQINIYIEKYSYLERVSDWDKYTCGFNNFDI